jgi:hypothetical protein
MPSGEEDEIVDRDEPLAFLIAPEAVRVFFFFPTQNPWSFENRFGDLITISQSRLIAAADREITINGNGPRARNLRLARPRHAAPSHRPH